MYAPDEQGYVDYVTARLPALHRMAYLMCGQRSLADDVVQQTVTTLFQHWRRISQMDNVEGYVHRMLMRKFLDFRRQRWARILLVRSLPDQPSPDPADSLGHRDAVSQALATLPPRQRAVVVLRYLCDLSIDETAEVLGCAAGTVKSQAARGLETLRPLLTDFASRTESSWGTP
jgi:RNA polymerase sigma-70 factor (sigma-E family)